jgi:MFS family permease
LVTVPILLSEVSTRSSKTLFGTLHQISIGVGMIVAQSLSFVFAKPWVWRYVLLVGFSIASALFAISGTIKVHREVDEGDAGSDDEGDEETPLVQREAKEVSVRDLIHAESIVKRGSESTFAANIAWDVWLMDSANCRCGPIRSADLWDLSG